MTSAVGTKPSKPNIMAFSMYMPALLVSAIKKRTAKTLILRFAEYYGSAEEIMQVVFLPRMPPAAGPQRLCRT